MNFRPLKLTGLTLILVILCSLPVAQAESLRYEFVDSSRSIMRAGPDQTLEMLIQQIYPDYKELWPQLEQEIRKRNPNAFNRYTGRVIPGERMKLVTIKVIHESTVLHQKLVGTVNSIKGYAIATDINGNDRGLTEKADLFEGDRLTTEKDATLTVKMIDGAEMYIKPDSSVRLTEYNMKSGFESGSRSIIDLIKGGLRKITGAIGANPLSIYRFQTGVMTIGVRGTDYVVKLCEENNCEHSAGRNDNNARLHVAVLDGLISLQDEEGAVGELIMGQYAVATKNTKVIVTDSGPVSGLLNTPEQTIFNKVKSSPDAQKESIWPWLLGGILLAI